MHIEFDNRGRARPNHWVVIDDFGTEHDCGLETGDFGGYCDPVAETRRSFLYDALSDPEYNRVLWSRPDYHVVRESVAFASPLGISIELDVRVEFELRPFWDERTWKPLWTQAEGATIHVIHASTDHWECSPTSTALTQKALEAFCWAYLELEKAREAAKGQAEARHG